MLIDEVEAIWASIAEPATTGHHCHAQNCCGSPLLAGRCAMKLILQRGQSDGVFT
jgi:hypothetical protein